jgi:LuxR family maltose regulon positive regulatory protein
MLQGLCFAYWSDASARKLKQSASRLLDVSQKGDLAWSYSFSRYFIGLGHYERNELSDAVRHLEVIVENPYQYPIQNVAHCSFLVSLCFQAQGYFDRARAVADTISELCFKRGNSMFIQLTEAFQADLDIRQGRLARAEKWNSSYLPPPPHCYQRHFNAELTSIRIMVAQNTKESLNKAVSRIETLYSLAKTYHQRRLLIDMLGFKALVADHKGDSSKAVLLLQEAVQLGQPEKLIRPLADLGSALFKLLNQLDLDHEGLEYVGKILSAIQKNQAETVISLRTAPPAETLSQREREILDLFSRNLSNREIAEQLFISIGTVKRHAHNIYGKLSVSNRHEAVSKARGLGMLNAG